MRLVPAADVFAAVARSQGVPASDVSAVLRQLLRRDASMLAPAPRSAVVNSVFDALAALDLTEGLVDAVETALDDLLTYGDLIELRPDHDGGHVIRPAPPTFVRHGQTIFILGVAGEHPSALPAALAARTDHHFPVRRIAAAPGEDLPSTLAILGLQELSMATWLRAPGAEDASAFVRRWRERLESAGTPSEDLAQLEVLASSERGSHYAARWQPTARRLVGTFVTRRVHAYGGRVWALAEYVDGRPVRLLDLEGEGRHQRACDVAWRLSAALDAAASRPHRVRVETDPGEVRLLFDAPIPAFAERRLALVGRKAAVSGALFSFAVPPEMAAAELGSLRELLWVNVETSRGAPQ